MEIEQLEAFLEMLKDLNVKAYSHDADGFSVEFWEPVVEQEVVDSSHYERQADRKKQGAGFEHPSLWPGGEPPKFPGKR